MVTEQERLRRKIRKAKATQKRAEHKLDMLQVLFHEEEVQKKGRDTFFNPLPNKQAPCIILVEGQLGLRPVRHCVNNHQVTKQFGTPHAAENYALCDEECQRLGYQIVPIAKVENRYARPL